MRFALNPEVGLKSPTEEGPGTDLLLRVLSKDLFCCFSTSSLVPISASLSLFLGKMESTDCIHVSLSDLHFVSCRTVSGIPITLCEHWSREQTCCKQWQLWPCSKEAHVCLGSSGNKSQLREERTGVGGKGRWAHSDTCCLWDMPAPRKQGWRNTPSHKSIFKRFLSPFLYIPSTHDLGEIKHLALRDHLEPQTWGQWVRKGLKQPQEQWQVCPASPKFILCCFTSTKGLHRHLYLRIKKKKKIWRQILVSFKMPKL